MMAHAIWTCDHGMSVRTMVEPPMDLIPDGAMDMIVRLEPH